MPTSPNYDRLRRLAALASVETTDPTILAEIQSTLTDLRETIQAIRHTPGLEGKVRSAIRSYLDERSSEVDSYAEAVNVITGKYQKAREAISHANAQFSQLIPKLNTPAETRALQEMAMVDFGEVYMTMFEYNKGDRRETQP